MGDTFCIASSNQKAYKTRHSLILPLNNLIAQKMTPFTLVSLIQILFLGGALKLGQVLAHNHNQGWEFMDLVNNSDESKTCINKAIEKTVHKCLETRYYKGFTMKEFLDMQIPELMDFYDRTRIETRNKGKIPTNLTWMDRNCDGDLSRDEFALGFYLHRCKGIDGMIIRKEYYSIRDLKEIVKRRVWLQFADEEQSRYHRTQVVLNFCKKGVHDLVAKQFEGLTGWRMDAKLTKIDANCDGVISPTEFVKNAYI